MVLRLIGLLSAFWLIYWLLPFNAIWIDLFPFYWSGCFILMGLKKRFLNLKIKDYLGLFFLFLFGFLLGKINQTVRILGWDFMISAIQFLLK